MELPNIGKHCSESSCKRLDFLPMKCDACYKTYCGDHVNYTVHSCAESYKKDNQVPVCPLCNGPIPVKKGQSADEVVGRHIDTDCQSDPAKERRKVYTNRCSAKGCKHKELIPVVCDKCRNNFCLKHRHEADHKCEGFQGSGNSISNAGAAAFSRFSKSKPSQTKAPQKSTSKPQQSSLSNIGRDLNRERLSRQTAQGALSEDEALARALQLSMSESAPKPQSSNPTPHSGSSQQEEEDLMLAQALYESEQEARNQQNRTENKDKSCMVS